MDHILTNYKDNLFVYGNREKKSWKWGEHIWKRSGDVGKPVYRFIDNRFKHSLDDRFKHSVDNRFKHSVDNRFNHSAGNRFNIPSANPFTIPSITGSPSEQALLRDNQGTAEEQAKARSYVGRVPRGGLKRKNRVASSGKIGEFFLMFLNCLNFWKI